MTNIYYEGIQYLQFCKCNEKAYHIETQPRHGPKIYHQENNPTTIVHKSIYRLSDANINVINSCIENHSTIDTKLTLISKSICLQCFQQRLGLSVGLQGLEEEVKLKTKKRLIIKEYGSSQIDKNQLDKMGWKACNF